MFQSKATGYVFLKGDINLSAVVKDDGNLLTIDSCLTIYATDDHLRKVADTIRDHLNSKAGKENGPHECTTHRQQAG